MKVERLEQFYAEILNTQNPEILQEAVQNTVLRTYAKGETILQQGEQATHLIFLLEGVVCGIEEDTGGKYTIVCIAYRSGEPITTRSEMEGENLCSERAVADCQVAAVPLPVVRSLMQRYPELVEAYGNCVGAYLRYHMAAQKAMRLYDAKGRYEWFLETFPGLIDLAPQKYIASFLNMTEVTLSRLRHQRSQ